MGKRVNLSISDGQYEVWSQHAKENDMSLHEFIKQAVRIYVVMLQKRAEKAKIKG